MTDPSRPVDAAPTSPVQPGPVTPAGHDASQGEAAAMTPAPIAGAPAAEVVDVTTVAPSAATAGAAPAVDPAPPAAPPPAQPLPLPPQAPVSVAAGAPAAPPLPGMAAASVPGQPAPPPAGQPAPPPLVSRQDIAQAASAEFAEVTAFTRGVLARLDPTGWRGTIAVAASLAILVIGMQFLNAIIPVPARGSQPGTGPGPGTGGTVTTPGTPLELTSGVRIYPQAGWREEAREGPTVRLSNGEVALFVSVFPYTGNAAELFAIYVRDVLQGQAQQLNAPRPTVIQAGGGRVGVRGAFSGLFKDQTGAIEGQLTTMMLSNGTGIVFDARGLEGGVARAMRDLDVMVTTTEVR